MSTAILVVTLALGQATAAVGPVEMKARESFAAGRYDEALQLFAKLYAETLHPVYLRNIGRCHQKMREPQKAIDAFQDYLAKSKKIAPDERTEIEGYIKEMEGLRDEQARAATPPPPPPPVLAAAPPPAPAQANPNPMMLTASPPPPAADAAPVYKRWWFWTIIGVVVVGGVATAVALGSGGTTKPPCTASVCK